MAQLSKDSCEVRDATLVVRCGFGGGGFGRLGRVGVREGGSVVGQINSGVKWAFGDVYSRVSSKLGCNV
jgi:hypothetical protein